MSNPKILLSFENISRENCDKVISLVASLGSSLPLSPFEFPSKLSFTLDFQFLDQTNSTKSQSSGESPSENHSSSTGVCESVSQLQKTKGKNEEKPPKKDIQESKTSGKEENLEKPDDTLQGKAIVRILKRHWNEPALPSPNKTHPKWNSNRPEPGFNSNNLGATSSKADSWSNTFVHKHDFDSGKERNEGSFPNEIMRLSSNLEGKGPENRNKRRAKCGNMVSVLGTHSKPGYLSNETCEFLKMESNLDPPPYLERLLRHENQTWYSRIWDERCRIGIPGLNASIPEGADPRKWMRAGVPIVHVYGRNSREFQEAQFSDNWSS